MTATASDAVRVDWQGRVANEYAVSAYAQDFALRLTMFGAPPDLIEQALAMAIDELAHATDAAEVSEAAGATGTPIFDPTQYISETDVDPAVDIAVAAVPSLCLGETLALRVTHRMRAGTRIPVARDALDRITRDEPRHAALGWQTLDWLLASAHEPVVRSRIEQELPRWVDALRADFAGPHPESHLTDVGPDELAWGLIATDEARECFAATVERDWRPRLARRGFHL